jgi:hypothetical protein
MSRRALIAVSLATALVGAIACAAPLESKTSGRPSLDLKAAIDCAERYAKDQEMDLSEHFMVSVVLITKPGMGKDFEWRVVWDRSEKVDDDEIELSVQMDKSVKRLFRG